MTLEKFLELKNDKNNIDLFDDEGNYIGIFPEGKIGEEKYLESEVLNFYYGFASVVNVTIEAPRNLVNIADNSIWDDILENPVFSKDGSTYRVVKDEVIQNYYLLDTTTYRMWELWALTADDFEGPNLPEFFTKENDPDFMGVEVR